MTEFIKDANDLLKSWQADQMPGDEQRARLREAMGKAPTMVEAAAAWAGQQDGSDQDAATLVVFGMISQMEPLLQAKYRSRLAKAMGISVRDFNNIAKAAQSKKKKGKDEDEGEPIYTLGGNLQGWLVDYVYDPEKDQALLAYRDPDGKVGMETKIEIEGQVYLPKPPNSFIRDGGVLFSSGLGSLKPTRELVAMTEAFIKQHYLLETNYLAKIIAYYVLLTWIYDSFNALPYLRGMGEPGAGKSELMRRIGHVCYRLMTASGANTSASFFRATEMYRGTVFIDEADLHDGGDMSNDIIKFLNQGAMKGNPIWRLEETYGPDGSKSYEPATYQTFCPKLIAMRKDFKDSAVGSRCLTLKLMPREPIELKSAGVRLYIDEEFREKAVLLRNMLLRWRLEHWQPEIQVNEDLMDLEISSRLNQVTMPLKALALDDEALQSEIEKFLRAYNMELVLSRNMTVAARVVEAIWKIYVYPDLRALMVRTTADGDQEYMMIGDVRRIANELMDEMNRASDEEPDEDKPKRKKDELSARGVGSVIRNTLQLHVGQRQGKGFPVYWDQLKMEALAKRYGVVPPEVKDVPKQNEIPF